jgi:hypothetical protein
MFQPNNLNNRSLTHFVKCFQKVPDPRSKRGVSQPFATILAITFLGLIANVNTPAATMPVTWRTMGKRSFQNTENVFEIRQNTKGKRECALR